MLLYLKKILLKSNLGSQADPSLDRLLFYMYSVYILYSPKLDKFYTGQSMNIESRIDMHNQKEFSGSFATQCNDWGLYFTMECNSRRQAILIEKHVRRMKSRKYLANLKTYPEIVEKLKEKYP